MKSSPLSTVFTKPRAELFYGFDWNSSCGTEKCHKPQMGNGLVGFVNSTGCIGTVTGKFLDPFPR